MDFIRRDVNNPVVQKLSDERETLMYFINAKTTDVKTSDIALVEYWRDYED